MTLPCFVMLTFYNFLDQLYNYADKWYVTSATCYLPIHGQDQRTAREQSNTAKAVK